MAKKKGKTPEFIDKLLTQRTEIGEEAYTEFWRRLNRAKKKGSVEFDAEGQRILRELQPEEKPAPIQKYRSLTEAQTIATKTGGRIVRRNAKGQFSKRGRTFQVIGGKNV